LSAATRAEWLPGSRVASRRSRSTTQSAVSSVRSDRPFWSSATLAAMSGFVRFSAPMDRAVLSLYPARIAA